MILKYFYLPIFILHDIDETWGILLLIFSFPNTTHPLFHVLSFADIAE